MEIKCPGCGCIRGVRRIEMIRTFAYLCPQEGCPNFDQEIHDKFFEPKKKQEDVVEKKTKKLKLELEIEELERQIDPISIGSGRGAGYSPFYDPNDPNSSFPD